MAVLLKQMTNQQIEMATLGGKGGATVYHPILGDDTLQKMSKEWRVRVLTEFDIRGLLESGQVQPAPLQPAPEGDDSEQTLFILSMLRLTWHSHRVDFAKQCLQARLLPRCYHAWVRDLEVQGPINVPVPGVMSSGAFFNLLPLLINFLDRLDGLNVGRMMVLVFHISESVSLNVPSANLQNLERLESLLRGGGVDQEIIKQWTQQVTECGQFLTEDHHPDPLYVDRMLRTGRAFAIHFMPDDTNLQEYAVVAKHAALRAKGKSHGDPELICALAQMVCKQLRPEQNLTLAELEPRTLDALTTIHYMSAAFWMENAAYRLAKSPDNTGAPATRTRPPDNTGSPHTRNAMNVTRWTLLARRMASGVNVPKMLLAMVLIGFMMKAGKMQRRRRGSMTVTRWTMLARRNVLKTLLAMVLIGFMKAGKTQRRRRGSTL